MARETAFPTHTNSSQTPASPAGARLSRYTRFLLFFLLLVAALSIRLYQAGEPPLDFHSTRQYRSLLIARGYYVETMESVPVWEREVARINRERQGTLEPPVMESIVALAYRVAGGEHFWVPQLMSSVFWLTGGWSLYLIARRVLSYDAALFAAAFYLLLPFSVIASRSFQPDPLMTMLLLLSVLAILRHYERPSVYRLMVAAAISAAACFIKPVSLFVVLGVFTAAAVYAQGIRRLVLSVRPPIFVAVVLLPTVAFYFYGLFIAGFLRDQAQASFLPQLLIHPWFWTSWLDNIRTVVGPVALAAALLGTAVCMLRSGLPRALMAGLWAGYVAFCLVFSYHIATHDYYHLQLIPIVALGVGSALAFIMRSLTRARESRVLRAAVWGVLMLVVLLDLSGMQSILARPDGARELAVAREVGEMVGHSTRTVFLSGSYGLPLQYHGKLSGFPWPLKSDLEWEEMAGVAPLSAPERFAASYSGDSPEYFIVLDMWELEQQTDLKSFLLKGYSLVHGEDYMVFDLRKPVADRLEGE